MVTTRAADKQCLPGEGNTRCPAGEAPIDDVTGDTPGSAEQLEENPVQSANCEWAAAELASLQASDSDIAPIREWLLSNNERPEYKTITPYSRETKTYWSGIL